MVKLAAHILFELLLITLLWIVLVFLTQTLSLVQQCNVVEKYRIYSLIKVSFRIGTLKVCSDVCYSNKKEKMLFLTLMFEILTCL